MGKFALFAVTGLELEYAVVDDDMRPQCLVEDAFRAAHGRPTSDVEYRHVGFSNELAAHVFETKTLNPERSLVEAETHLLEGLSYFTGLLRDRFGARLMPGGMHPFMTPADTRLWERSGREIYAAYASIFDIHQHGWLNVQSCHVNLPFGRSETDTVLLHNAVASLLPYLPAIAASSAVFEGRLGPCVDNRLQFYKTNQREIPEISGAVVPELILSLGQYREQILKPIYRALRRVRGAERLRHEWVNSRGAILRFQRSAIELRVLDVQECVRMDVAIAAFVRGALKWMVEALRTGSLVLPDYSMLVSDYGRVVRDGRDARVDARHIGDGSMSERRAADVLGLLLQRARAYTPEPERVYLDFVADRLARGSVSEMMRARLRGRAARSRIRDAYEELIECLEANRPWRG